MQINSTDFDAFNRLDTDPIEIFKRKYSKFEQLIVSTPLDPPFTFDCIFKWKSNSILAKNSLSKSQCQQPGINFELFEFFAQLVGLNWKLIEAEMNSFKFINSTDGRVHGLLGMLQRKEVHGSASLVYLEEEDELPLADYTFPVGITYGGMVYLTPNPYQSTARTLLGVLLPFRWEIWICTICTILLTFNVHYFVFKKFASTFSCVVFKLFVAICATFLIYSFQSKMTSLYLLDPKVAYPFADFEGLSKALTDKSYQMVTHSYSRSFLYTVNTSDDRWMMAIRKSFDRNPLILAKNRDDALSMVANNPRLVYFASSQFVYDSSAIDYCNLTFIVDPLPRYLVFAFQKYSGLSELFNRFMYASGYSASDLNLIIERRYRRPKRCTVESAQTVAAEKPLALRQLYGAFVFATFGFGFSFMALFLEILREKSII